MPKIWINEHRAVHFAESNPLRGEIATRERRMDWSAWWGLLPDPDPVLRKLGEDMAAYRGLLSDAHVWSCWQSRAGGTLAREWRLEPPAGKKRAGKAAMDTVETALDQISMTPLLTDILYANLFGMSPVEITWGRDGGKWLPGKVEGKPPEWFGFDDANEPRFISAANMIQGEALPAMKFLLPRHFASYLNPYGERLLSRCFWPVTFKRGGMKFWAIFAEKFGMPWVTGKVPRGTNDSERDALLGRLSQMVQDAVSVINDDESVDITEAAGKQGSSELYERLVRTANGEVSKALVGQTLSTEMDQGGSYAASKSHMEVRADLIQADQKLCKKTVQTLVDWIVLLNHGPDAAPPKFIFYEDEDIQSERAERDEKLYGQGVRFSKGYFERAYAFEPGEIEIKEDADPPPELAAPAVPVPAPEDPAPEPEADAPVKGGDETDGEPEFAEDAATADPDGEAAMDAVEAMADRAARQSAAAVEALLAKIENAGSFAEIQGELMEMGFDESFAETLARAKFAAALAGAAAEQENEGSQ